MYLKRLKEMFSEMVEKKNASLIPKYYHQSLQLYANGQVQDYDYFVDLHEKIFQTEIGYKVSYDEDAFLEQGEKLSARLFLTISKPNEPDRELEFLIIIQFKDNKIFKFWQLCYPDLVSRMKQND